MLCGADAACLSFSYRGSSKSCFFKTVAQAGVTADPEYDSGLPCRDGEMTDTVYSSTHHFDFTGAMQTWTVPPGVTEVSVRLWGAGGGGGTGASAGGGGGYTTGMLSVTPGETLSVMVGGGGNSKVGGAETQGSFGGGGKVTLSTCDTAANEPSR